MCSSYVLQFLVQHPDPLRRYGEQCMITLILFRKVRVSHGAQPSLPQALHDAAVERIVPGHLCYGNMQHVVQSLEDTETEGDLRQLRVSRLHQPQYHIRVIDVVREHSGEAVFISGVAVRAVKDMIGLARNARDPGNDVLLIRQQLHQQVEILVQRSHREFFLCEQILLQQLGTEGAVSPVHQQLF